MESLAIMAEKHDLNATVRSTSLIVFSEGLIRKNDGAVQIQERITTFVYHLEHSFSMNYKVIQDI